MPTAEEKNEIIAALCHRGPPQIHDPQKEEIGAMLLAASSEGKKEEDLNSQTNGWGCAAPRVTPHTPVPTGNQGAEAARRGLSQTRGVTSRNRGEVSLVRSGSQWS